jgi:PPOX class probable F420-dependent enzyme
MASLDDFAALLAPERGLVVVATARADGSVQGSVVNAGVLDHPVTGARVVGIVCRGDAVKLVHLRRDPRLTAVVRSGWQWVAVEGRADLIGPDDPYPGVEPEARRELLRAVFRAAGGTHDDWDAYDRAMIDERRAAVLVTPTRIYSN